MSVVLDEAEEVYVKSGARKEIGRILLKGENISLLQAADSE
jgi:small nuclear ribonucleoprotein E